MIYQGDALGYIYETPHVLMDILENENKILKDSQRLLNGKMATEVFLTGSGSSYNAAAAAADLGRKLLGIRVNAVYPVTLMKEKEIISPKAVVLGISQQGTSTAVIHALDCVRKRGITAISVTGEYETEITRHSDSNIYIECGYEDAGATTKGYTATVQTLMLFMIMFSLCSGRITVSDAEAYKKRIRAVIRNMEHVLADSLPWCRQTAEKLKDSTDLILIAGSSMKSWLLEGVLKFSETCRFPVRGYETEEFMHGMYNAVTLQTDFLYLFPAESHEYARTEQLYAYYGKQGNCQYAVNRQIPSKETKNNVPCRFLGDPDFSVLEYMLPQQMLFVFTSRAKGINLNVPRDPDFHKIMKSKLEGL